VNGWEAMPAESRLEPQSFFGLAATVLTAGALGGFAAAGIAGVVGGASFTAADLAVAGAAGGIVGSVGSSYAAGNSWGRISLDGAVGGVAGAIGGLVGAAVPGAAQLCPAAVESWVVGGVAGGAAGGPVQGTYEGGQASGWSLNGIAGGALQGTVTGGLIGGLTAPLEYRAFKGLGLLDGLACFPADTQVAYGKQAKPASSAHAAGSIAVAQFTYLTISIEKITQDSLILASDENDPFGPLRLCRVEKVFCRITFHLRVLTMRMSDGREQTICATDDHPAYESETLWTPAGELKGGDQLMEGSGGMAAVVATRYEAHPEGIEVFNIRIEEAHTYFVRANGFDGELIWVHNMCTEHHAATDKSDEVPLLLKNFLIV
jgi:hypothetical protein